MGDVTNFRCLVFDTETTNIIQKKRNADGTMKTIIPRVIQLGYVVYDTSNPENAKIYDKLININDDVEISEGAAKVHGITKESIRDAPTDKKVTIEEALREFLYDAKECKYIVAHNVVFDRSVLLSEIRHLPDGDLKAEGLALFDTFTSGENWTCTMQKNVNVCKLQSQKQRELDEKLVRQGKEPKNYYKFPKLSETYKHYFHYEPNEAALHDAIIDVILCVRVFVRYMTGKDICGSNGVITDYIKRITPDDFNINSNCPVPDDSSVILRGGRRTRRRKYRRYLKKGTTQNKKKTKKRKNKTKKRRKRNTKRRNK